MKPMDYFQNQYTSDEIIQKIKGFSSWIEIDLDNIGKNLETVKSISNSEVIPCLKKNAYAHGIAPITAYLMSMGVQTVLVAKLWEAKTIRRAGLDCGIVNMDPIYTIDQYKWIVEQKISQVIYHYESAKKLNEIANQMNNTQTYGLKLIQDLVESV